MECRLIGACGNTSSIITTIILAGNFLVQPAGNRRGSLSTGKDLSPVRGPERNKAARSPCGGDFPLRIPISDALSLNCIPSTKAFSVCSRIRDKPGYARRLLGAEWASSFPFGCRVRFSALSSTGAVVLSFLSGAELFSALVLRGRRGRGLFLFLRSGVDYLLPRHLRTACISVAKAGLFLDKPRPFPYSSFAKHSDYSYINTLREVTHEL